MAKEVDEDNRIFILVSTSAKGFKIVRLVSDKKLVEEWEQIPTQEAIEMAIDNEPLLYRNTGEFI